jgi:hypothetical protein
VACAALAAGKKKTTRQPGKPSSGKKAMGARKGKKWASAGAGAG